MVNRQRWDIFCTVIDNYGDIGITWRLARQLAHEHDLKVRLWVDDLRSFRTLCPAIRAELEVQTHAGVEVRHWTSYFTPTDVADVVIEALACHLPESYEIAMAERPVKPVWINLEYLSAEDWVAGCHALPSPHPRLPLTKHFFMPGYVSGTGGVLKENRLEADRIAFQANPAARRAFWDYLRQPPESPGELRISLFSYETRSVRDLFRTWETGPERIRCLVPRGKVLGDVGAFFDAGSPDDGADLTRGNLTVTILPMLDMDSYDRLLWACDGNFVRGEDSFVRAQWARKPMVWQAYRQEEGAHWSKIEAFLARYCSDLPDTVSNPVKALWRAWNADNGLIGEPWLGFRTQWPALEAHAANWATRLDALGDLASNLVKFCNEKP